VECHWDGAQSRNGKTEEEKPFEVHVNISAVGFPMTSDHAGRPVITAGKQIPAYTRPQTPSRNTVLPRRSRCRSNDATVHGGIRLPDSRRKATGDVTRA
jgi:hypothetical protein